MSPKKTIILGVTGASGMIYTIRLIKGLLSAKVSIYCVFSEMGKQVLAHESQNIGLFAHHYTGQSIKAYLKAMDILTESNGHLLEEIAANDFFAKPASGSFQHDGMVVVPCSMKSTAAIACGLSDNLLLRSADVCLKENRPLILVPREMPFGRIHLNNMLTLSEQGVIILPACPGFYTMPESIMDLADFVAARIMDHLTISHDLSRRWGAMKENK
ncbi:MAG: UbiX family flavin prenyltransferase [Candidatus Magnetomorum sp.]|nr:UbiX family flavin prenyltransferase [Candidatus Magnetomorum sp.]